MTRYGMAIDLTRCFGCHVCEVACKIANNNPSELDYNHVYTVGGVGNTDIVKYDAATGTYPNLVLSFLPMQCQHCANPACVAVCPTGASRQDDNGIVWVDEDACIGCDSCITACPYEGVRTHVSSTPQYYLDVVVGESDAPLHPGNTVEKCTFCRNLVSRGEVPACMQLCPGRARYWGDIEDETSEISKLVASRTHVKLQESAGTEPSVYYLL